AARLELILEIERTVLGPDAPTGRARPIEQLGHRRAACPTKRTREKLNRREAVIHRPVPVIEKSASLSEIAELGAFVSIRGPVDLRHRAGPSLGGEHRVETFQKAS